MAPSIAALQFSSQNMVEYDEDAFADALVGVNIQRSFEAVNAVLKAGVKLDSLIATLVLLAADRMARTPVNVDAGWDALAMELNLAASLRTAQRHGGNLVAAKGLFHAAWLIFSNRWINIPARSLSVSIGGGKLDAQSLAANLVGTIVKDPVQDKLALQEYLENVVRSRDGWSDLYRAIREVM